MALRFVTGNEVNCWRDLAILSCCIKYPAAIFCIIPERRHTITDRVDELRFNYSFKFAFYVIIDSAGGDRGKRVGALTRKTTIIGPPHLGHLHRPGVSTG